MSTTVFFLVTKQSFAVVSESCEPLLHDLYKRKIQSIDIKILLTLTYEQKNLVVFQYINGFSFRKLWKEMQQL